MQQNQAAILLLEDGTVFKGIAIGKIGTTGGEIAFNTGMTGYQEVFTDPSYLGQLLIMTTSHIGNYGVHEAEIESDSTRTRKRFALNQSAATFSASSLDANSWWCSSLDKFFGVTGGCARIAL